MPTRRGVLALAGLFIGMAGCIGDDASPEPSPSPTATPTATPTSTPTPQPTATPTPSPTPTPDPTEPEHHTIDDVPQTLVARRFVTFDRDPEDNLELLLDVRVETRIVVEVTEIHGTGEQPLGVYVYHRDEWPDFRLDEFDTDPFMASVDIEPGEYTLAVASGHVDDIDGFEVSIHARPVGD